MKYYHYSDSDRFQGCIGQVTHNAPGKPPEPLPLRNSLETGRFCESQCIFGGKCDNHTDDVGKSDEECECPGFEVEKELCGENLTHAQKSLSIGFNKTDAFSTTVTPNLMSSRQIKALATTAHAQKSLSIGFNKTDAFSTTVTPNLMSSRQIKALATTASLLNTATNPSRDIATQAYSTSSRQRGSTAFSASSSITSISAKPSSSTAGPFSSSIDNQVPVMQKKSSAFFSRGSCVLLCLGSLVAVQSSWPFYVQ